MTVGDPRVYFAAERTLLAWIRTGLAFMGFGFVLGRYRVFLAVPTGHHIPSLALGITLVLLGVFTILAPLVQFRRFAKTLPPMDLPQSYSAYPSVISAVGLAIFGVLLAAYLLFSSPDGPVPAEASSRSPWDVVRSVSGYVLVLPGETQTPDGTV